MRGANALVDARCHCAAAFWRRPVPVGRNRPRVQSITVNRRMKQAESSMQSQYEWGSSGWGKGGVATAKTNKEDNRKKKEGDQ